MASENSAHFACGQILFGLKNSKLNYLVKETPYSAYITIRKKFVRDTIENDSIPQAKHTNLIDKESQRMAIEERNKDLETRLALATVNFEEMELQKEDLLKKISKQDDEIETFIKNDNILTEKIKVLTNENEDLKRIVHEITGDIEELEAKNETLETEKSDLDDRLEEVHRELSDLQHTCIDESLNKTEKLEKKLFKCQQNLKEATENVVILEHTLDNKVSEIESLKLKFFEEVKSNSSCEICEKSNETEKELKEHGLLEHEEENLPSTSKCGTCDYDSADEIDLKTHMESNHVIQCDLCSFGGKDKSDMEDHDLFEHNFPCPNCLHIFRTPEKEDTHICKLEIMNPIFETLYMRNWLDGNGCNSVMCNEREQEVIILHNDYCVSGQRLCCWSPYSLATINKNEVTHLARGKYAYERKMKHREILWSKLVEDIEKLR